MIPYIIHVGVILAGCLAFYRIFLRNETFYKLNRMVLLLCLGLAFTLPLVPVPQQWSFRSASTEKLAEDKQEMPQYMKSASPSNITEPIKPGGLTVQPEANPPAINTDAAPVFSMALLMKWMVLIYWFGVIMCSLNFLMQFGLLIWRAYTHPVIRDGQNRIVEMEGDQSPCSFLNNIFINPSRYDNITYNQILAHEKIHVAERHSLDILIAEILLIFQWFNPFAWAYRKEVENNLEFLTDNQVLRNGDTEITSYQMSLLKVSAAHLPLSLTTNYNQSLLKKRIAMMNTKRSNLNSAWKYCFLLPLVALFACLLNEPLAQTAPASKSQTKTSTATQSKQPTTKSANTKTTTNTKSTANTKNSTNTNKTKSQNKDKDKDHEMKTEGYWFATIKGDKIQIRFSNSAEKDEDNYGGSDFPLSDFSNLPKGANGDFKLTREAGTMNFNGKFEGNQGTGKYKYAGDKSYEDFMSKEVADKLDDEDHMVFFMLDIKKAYVQMLKDEGYARLEKDQLISMVALDVDKALIRSLKENGFDNADPEELVSVKAMSIDGAYIKEIRDAGYKNITLDQLVAFKAQGIDKEYLATVSKMKKEDGSLDADEVISLKAMGIDDEYASQFKEVGLTNISNEDLISMKAVGVTPEVVKEFRKMGYEDATVDDYVSMKSLNVTPEFLKGFQAIGYKDIKADDLVALKSLGVTPSYIKGFNDIGYKNIPLDDVISAKATGITPAYVKSMKGKGFNYNNLEKYVTLKSLSEND